MATLTNAALFTKKFLLGIGIFVIVLIGLFFFLMISGNIKNSLFPAQGEPAYVAFNKLPPLNLSEGIQPVPGTTYDVETVSGQLDELEGKMRVFGIKKPDARFGDVESADSMAQSGQFNIPAIRNDNGTAVYKSSSDPSRALEIELKTGNIFVNSGYLNNQEVITTQAKAEKPSGDIAGGFLKNFNINLEAFDEKKTEYLKLKVDGGKLTDAVSLSTANIIQVNYYSSDIDKIPVKSPQFRRPKVRVLVASNGVVAAKASASQIQKYKFSTYPLKGIQKAFEDLKAGKAAYNKVLGENFFVIRNVSLAYMDTESFQDYLQPVYVFETDDGLEAYVGAVSDDWIVK